MAAAGDATTLKRLRQEMHAMLDFVDQDDDRSVVLLHVCATCV